MFRNQVHENHFHTYQLYFLILLRLWLNLLVLDY
nr:MAG TPA: hypothetical protein [Caudoviricetes sp.]